MKKLIIAVAAVAMGVSAQAKSAKELDAQVYDFSATVKSTQCKEIKYSKDLAAMMLVNYQTVKGQKVLVRKQTSTKIVGVIWGCNCETIANPDWRIYPGTKWPTIGGYLFWNSKSGVEFNIGTTAFGWALFDRIDDGNKVEGVWALVNDDADNALAFLGAGFGKASGTGFTVGANGNLVAGAQLCRPVLSSMSGSFAGFLLSGSDADGCMFCGSNGCAGLPFCWWCYDMTAYNAITPLTAAHGSWSIKYNKSAANKLRKTGLLSKSYSFKKVNNDLVARLEKIEAAVANEELTAALDDDDDDDDADYDDYDFDDYTEGAHVDKVDVAKFAVAKAGATEEEADEAWEKAQPDLFSESDEESAIVKALLSIATGDDDEGDDEGDAS